MTFGSATEKHYGVAKFLIQEDDQFRQVFHFKIYFFLKIFDLAD
jgi:hypothetical protein